MARVLDVSDAPDSMDPDAEFNSLTTLHNSVLQDMKLSYGGWESVSQKAAKLANALKVTSQCLSAFVDSVQSVSDHANNLKGASRDVGACVTRVCMRERALENRLRSWADALSDELSISLQQRLAYWKARTSELDKATSKQVKKVRARKTRPDITSMAEHRELCTKVLLEQRNQLAFFVGTLMPVLNAQISVLDEGAHIRQVAESLEETIKHVDAHKLVSTIVSDVGQGADSAWKQCLNIAGQKWRNSTDGCSVMGSVRDLSTRATTPASNFSSEDNELCGTLTNSGFLASRGVSTSNSSLRCQEQYQTSPTQNGFDNGSNFGGKPPLMRRNSDRSLTQFSMVSTSDSQSTFMNGKDVRQKQSPPSYQQYVIKNRPPAPLMVSTRTPSTPQMEQSSCSSSDAASSSAILIAETLQQIDQLGSDLDSYCAANDMRVIENPRQEIKYVQPPVRMRNASGSRPPPPVRRSSQISSATPNAPSIAEARMSMASMRSSQQSLDSSHLYDQRSIVSGDYNHHHHQHQAGRAPSVTSFGRQPAAANLRF